VTDPIRIAITGAAGSVGYALIFRIAAGGLFGADHPIEIRLQDLPSRLPVLEACRMELKDCAFPFLSDVRIDSDPRRAFDGADWVIMLAGKSFKDRTSRLDLLRENVSIFVEHGRALNVSCPNARVLVVASPVNTGCMIARAHAPSVPPEHFFALNRVIRMRATSLIAEHLRVPVCDVTRVTTWGNNSETAFIDVHNAWVGDQPAHVVIPDPQWVREVLEPTVVLRTQTIRHLHGRSASGTVAQGVLGTIRSITTPTPFDRWFGAGVVSDGSYGVPRGLFFGYPLTTPDGRTWSIRQGQYLDGYAEERLAANIAELEHEAAVAAPYL
jgi:malate dehydrogenase